MDILAAFNHTRFKKNALALRIKAYLCYTKTIQIV